MILLDLYPKMFLNNLNTHNYLFNIVQNMNALTLMIKR